MRIISGIYKGRVIRAPACIRPTQDKVRKALFDILGDIGGLSFLELYAGSGAVGFEAVSRGAAEVTLVENNQNCLMAIRKNMESLKPKGCTLCSKEAGEAIKLLHEKRLMFDVIFLDPPYYEEFAKKTLQNLSAYDILAPNGFTIVQHFKKDKLPDCEGALILCRQARYGDTVLSFYKKRAKEA